jgi:methylmalonyl-CoA mutase cobalamin-binding subunit
MSQYVWDYPYSHDDVAQVIEVVKALGIMASKREDGAIIITYVGDGIPGQLLDHVSEVGYVLLEKYVADDLCGAAYAAALGGVHSYIPAKLATWLALNDTLKSDHSVLTFYQGNTLEPTDDFEANYGLVVSDFIPFAILERKHKTGVAYTVNPVTECMRVPTLQEIKEAYSACIVALQKALEYEEAKMLDDSHINQLRSMLVREGRQFSQNALKKLSQMGVDINDPLQVLLAVRRLGGRKLEEMAHPGERDPSRPRGFVPFLPTDLIKQPLKDLDRITRAIRSERLGDAVKGKKFVIGSTDTHEYGLFVVNGLLNTFGSMVVNGGVDLDAEQILDLAAEEGTPYIAVSTHNGLCLDWGRHLMEVAKQRSQHVKVFMGGRLNAIVEDVTEPIDVSDRLSKLGITPCKDPTSLFREMS